MDELQLGRNLILWRLDARPEIENLSAIKREEYLEDLYRKKKHFGAQNTGIFYPS
jgi:hypothetical protein